MSFVSCSVDGVRPQEKPATLYWAWFDTSGSRHAYKQILCVSHFIERILPMQVATEERWSNCPACGIDSTEDLDGIYCTVFAPGCPKKVIELSTCSACAARVRIAAMEGALEMEDRQLGASVAAPNVSSATVWASLGREP